ncbi:MAG: twin-arginine translocase subunit TatC [Chloroflexota bacterium]
MSVVDAVTGHSSPAGEDEPEKTMTILEHLEELRFRLTISVIAILLGMIPGWFLSDGVISLLRQPIAELGPLNVLGVTGMFTLRLKVGATLAVCFAFPVLFSQIWAFVAPGLTRRERRHSLPFIVLGTVLFVAGVYTGYRIVPLAVNFLLSFTDANLRPMLVADQYVGFVAIVALIFGVSFELPMVLLFLCSINVISSGWLLKKLKFAIIIIFIVSTIITPGADLVSPVVLGVILSALYLLAIVLAKIIGK